MIIIKNPQEIDAMRVSGRKTATILHKVAAKIAPGVTTQELDDYARDLAVDADGICAFYGYSGFPGRICISVNEAVVHGVPGRYIIREGDIVGLDFGLIFDGFIGDTAITVPVGNIDPKVQKLLDATKNALNAGIAKAVEGNRLSDISHAVQKSAESAGFSVVRDFVGHGIGRDLHEDPQIPNYGMAGRGPVLKAGMTFAIEPMINLGTHRTKTLKDKWTVVTKDLLPSAHFEHTVAIRKGPAEILTTPDL